MPRTAEIRERQQSHARLDTEAARGFGRGERDFSEVFRIGLDIDRRVRQKINVAALRNQQVKTRDSAKTFAHGNYFKGGPDGVGIMLGKAADQRVRVAK